MNIFGDFADTVCIGGKMHGVHLFAFIYKEGCPDVRMALVDIEKNHALLK